jgi:hypothetical protein
MYIVVHPFFNKKKIQLKYSKTELVDHISDIQHPIFREVLGMYDLKGVDVNSIADIPAGTGMGSSSSFTVGLINAVRAYVGKYSSAEKLASLACETEIGRVGSPIGKQDQYAAAYGGFNYITFYPDESVKVEKVLLSNSLKKQLEESLILIHVGGRHSANEILQDQQIAISDAKKLDTQRKMVKLAEDLRKTLQKGNIEDFGMFLNEGWEMKRSLVSSISNNEIDDIYCQGLKAGALGGKLLGAGGAGFLLFYCPKEKQDYFRHEMHNFMELEFKFDQFGSQVVYVGDKFTQ